MQMSNYLKAYTIMEVLITLVISSMVITLMYTVFLYLDQQMVSYQKQTTAFQEYKIFETILQRDMYLCETILYKSETQLDLIAYDQSIVTYKKEGTRLYRKSLNGLYTSIGTPVLSWELNRTKLSDKEGVLLKVNTIIDRDTLELQFPKMKKAMHIIL